MYRFSGDGADEKNAKWDALIEAENHWFIPSLYINDGNNSFRHTEDEIIDMSTEYHMFEDDTPGVGACLAGELTVSLFKPSENIPRMAKVNAYVMVTDGTQTSNELPQGRFFIDTRSLTKNDDGLEVLTLHCYDAMLKAEADYPNTNLNWPASDIDVIKEIAMTMGLQASVSSTDGIDTRTITAVSNGYQIGLPAGQTMREVLSNIAAMYGGNWIMSYDGKLLLVKLADLPPETNLLVTPAGIPFVFEGGSENVRILV